MSHSMTTHVLDLVKGKPAAGMQVSLDQQMEPDHWERVGHGTTGADGRITGFLSPGALQTGVYRLVFDTGAYFKAQGTKTLYPTVSVIFVVDEPNAHYHIPLLLSPYGYSTYRGS